VAQATTTHTGRRGVSRAPWPACYARLPRLAAGAGAPACARGSGPGCVVRVTWHQPPPQPDSADLRSKPPVPGGV